MEVKQIFQEKQVQLHRSYTAALWAEALVLALSKDQGINDLATSEAKDWKEI